MIDLTPLDADEPYELGGTVTVRVRWSGLDARTRSLRVGAVASVLRGGECDDIAGAIGTGEVTVRDATGEADVVLSIPQGAPITYDGRAFSVVWRVLATVDVARSRDSHHEGPTIMVRPAGAGLRSRLDQAPPPVAG